MHQITWPPEGAARIGMNRFDAIDPAKTALIVIDLQVAFLDPEYFSYCANAVDILPKVHRLTRAARELGWQVVYTRHTTIDDPVRGPPPWQREMKQLERYFAGLERSSPGHALHSSLDVQPGDIVVDKTRFSAFLPISSTLDADLRARGIDTVIITGTVTNICCESSARDAHMLNYKVFFVSDATAASSDAHHNASLEILGICFADVRRTDELLSLSRSTHPALAAG
jgi:ureidoacrylate peracid hydrolase